MWRNPIFILLLPWLLYCNKCNAGVANKMAESKENIFSKTNGPEKKVLLLLAESDSLKTTYPDKALKTAETAYFIASKEKLQDLSLKALITTGGILAMQTNLVRMMEITMKAKELALLLNNKLALGEVYYLIGLNNSFCGDYPESYTNFFTALRIFEEVSNPKGIIKSLNGIGSVCYSQRNYPRAYYYYSNALNKARETKDLENVANVLNNMGLVYASQNKFEQAKQAYQEAIEFNKQTGQLLRLAFNYLNLGVLQRQQKQYKEFKGNYHNAVELLSRFRNNYNLSICYLEMSHYFNDINCRDSALFYAKKAFTEGIMYKMKGIILKSSTTIHDLYKESKNTDSAYKYSQIEYLTKDSLNYEKALIKLTQIETVYKYEKRIKETQVQQERRSYLFIIIVILLFSTLVVTLIYISRQRIRVKNINLENQKILLEKDHIRLANEQLKRDVEYKNKELTVNVMNLIRKNEFIMDISEKLMSIEQQSTDKKTKTDILKLAGKLQKTPQDEIWEEFEIRFKQVYSTFYENLSKEFPDISPNELKICALLRLNLSTKEICELSGQRPSSVDQARYRLRKKIGISNSEVNLVTFLSKF